MPALLLPPFSKEGGRRPNGILAKDLKTWQVSHEISDRTA